METLIHDLQDAVAHLRDAAAPFEDKKVRAVIDNLEAAISKIAPSWSQSWLGYHAYVYYDGFKTPPAGAHFSVEWGFEPAFSGSTTGVWREYTYDDVYKRVMHLAGDPDLAMLTTISQAAENTFEQSHPEVITSVEAYLATHDDKFLQGLAEEIRKVKTFSQEEMITAHRPAGQILSRDMHAIGQGLKVPPHLAIECKMISEVSPKFALVKLADLADQVSKYVRKKEGKQGMAHPQASKVFIGHGDSPVWRDLKDFLHDRLHLEWDEFNRKPPAGYATVERLRQMLDEAKFAFLVFTAEDEHSDLTKHARENVIHEAGLFQGRLGFQKAIILLEDGCSELSNIHGLTQIRFPKGKLDSKFEEIRRVLEREGIV